MRLAAALSPLGFARSLAHLHVRLASSIGCALMPQPGIRGAPTSDPARARRGRAKCPKSTRSHTRSRSYILPLTPRFHAPTTPLACSRACLWLRTAGTQSLQDPRAMPRRIGKVRSCLARRRRRSPPPRCFEPPNCGCAEQVRSTRLELVLRNLSLRAWVAVGPLDCRCQVCRAAPTDWRWRAAAPENFSDWPPGTRRLHLTPFHICTVSFCNVPDQRAG
jgi:hypothetical protein